MKLGQKPGKIWHETKELSGNFSRLNSQLNRLLLLDSLWDRVTGTKAKFWVLYAVKGGTIYVKVNVMVARHELLLRQKTLISELNKNFDKPWIKQISII